MKRKGVSPVFATALLVLVTVIAGILFYSWYKGYQRETQGRMDEASYPLSYIGAKIDVSDLNVEKIDVDGDALPDKYIVSFVLKNVGSVDLHNIQIFVDDKQESIVDYLSQNSFKSVKITLKTKPVRLHIICKEGISFQSDLPQVEKVIYDPGNLLFYVSNSRKISFSLPSGIIKDFIIKIENVGENTALLNIALNGVQIASPLRVEKLEKKEIRLEDITRKKAFLQYGVNVIDVTIVDDSGNPASGNINVYIHPIVEFAEYPVKKLWLSGWQYRREIVIQENSGKNLNDYQIKVELDSSNFDFSKAKPDGSDIRFTDSDGTTLLAYWIEEYNFSNQKATIWVKVPSIPANSQKTIYIYYGNSDPPPCGICNNGKVTFDGFWTWDSDAEGWSASGPRGEGFDEDVGNPPGSMYGDSCPWDRSADSICSHSGCSEWHIDWVLPEYTYKITFDTRATRRDGGLVLKIKNQEGSWIKLYDACEGGEAWRKREVTYSGDVAVIRFEQYGTRCVDWSSCNGEHRWTDNLIIRKYTSPEPTVSVKAEETA